MPRGAARRPAATGAALAAVSADAPGMVAATGGEVRRRWLWPTSRFAYAAG
ncbi:hypothetical protein [Micromonospora matsumotoense]|uniref:hypothetical protein n=1 Tax=Micromonospora matsumotoense TaxID=121616 RepID=UPI0033FAAED4